MKKIFFICILILYFASLFSQVDKKEYAADLSRRIDAAVIQRYQQVEPYFKEAYSLYPSVPRGMLEAVSFTYTRFTHLVPPEDNQEEGSVPYTYGLMGLTLDGQGFFRDNLHLVSELSGFSVESIMSSPRDNVVAYAAAYTALHRQLKVCSDRFEAQMPVLVALSELPLSDDSVLMFALRSSLYAMACFLDDDHYRAMTSATVDRPDFQRCFGKMLPELQAGQVQLPVLDDGSPRTGGADYNGAVWNPAGTCNYTSGRGGHAISAVTIHYTQGTYAGSIAWFQNCTYNGVGARASAHYIIRSFDGQVTQMVREADKAWHVGNCNPYTIGIEHEAYGDIASYFTPEMYQSSAALVRDICDRNGISPHRMFYRDTLDDGTVLNDGLHSLGGENSCVKIRGHQHFPNQSHTDPGPYWNWNYYYKLVNEDTPVTRLNTPSGTLTDSGGADGDYGNDERQLLLIQVDGADSITLSFSEFNLEDNYDFLWIYDGATVFSPLIGRWNTTSPGIVTSSGNALLVEFRSDCATTATGWVATWQATMPTENQSPITDILWDENQWVTEDFTLSFNDADDYAVTRRFYQAVGYNGRQWTANPNVGFAYDDFNGLDSRLWSVRGGSWRCDNGRLQQTSTAASEISIPLQTNLPEAYLYEFEMALPSGNVAGRSAGIRFGSYGSAYRQNAYEVTVVPDENRICISRLHQGSQTLLCTMEGVVTSYDSLYHYQIVHDEPAGKISVFRNGQLVGECQTLSTVAAPSNGVRMSFVTQGTAATFDALRVYRSRGTTVSITVGSGGNQALQWQASNGVPTARIRSVIVDDEASFSEVAETTVLVDYSRPSLRGSVSFGLNGSAEYSPTHTSSFHWPPASDPHSGIAYYEYGTTPDLGLGTTAISWLGTTEELFIELRPNIRIMEPSYLAVRAVNGAELRSAPIFSEVCGSSSRTVGAMKVNVTEMVSSDNDGRTRRLRLWPNPAVGTLNVELPASSTVLSIFDARGRKVYERASVASGVIGEEALKVDISTLKRGIYFVRSVDQDGHYSSASFVKQ